MFISEIPLPLAAAEVGFWNHCRIDDCLILPLPFSLLNFAA
jgi:hypothetical protein